MADPDRQYTVTGPYRYTGDLHASFTIRSDTMVIASVFAADGDEDAARRQALVMAHALYEGASDD
jgi:hypothetical protein